MRSNQTSMSLIQKIRAAQAADPAFQKAHRMIQGIMGAWALIVIVDRAIGLLTHAYGPQQLPFALLGGAALIALAFLGTRGHIQGAMMVMQVNMAVVLIQFAATCFLYREKNGRNDYQQQKADIAPNRNFRKKERIIFPIVPNKE